MSFLSFLRLFGVRRPRKARRLQSQPRGRGPRTPLLELLESRVLLTNDTPYIVSTAVQPLDGSSTISALPTLVVQFSEPMVGTNGTPNGTGAADTANYLLTDASGNPVTINTVTLSNSATYGNNSVATLTYNGGSNLPVNNYTLFVHGDKLKDADDGRTLAGPGQLVVANSGRNNVSTVSLPGNGTLGSMSEYGLPPQGTTTATPVAVKLADVDGDGVQDLIVVDSANNQVSIFLGQSAAAGGGFDQSPDLTLALPSSAAPTAQSLVVADLHDKNGGGLPDIAVANSGANNISVFLNQSTPANLNFAARADYAASSSTVTPVSLVAADINNDGYLDLATANSAAPADLNANSSDDYSVSVLLNAGGATAGTFGTATLFSVGEVGTASGVSPVVSPSGVVAPTGIAAGDLNGDNLPDLVVSGGNGNSQGIGYLINTTTTKGASTPTFAAVAFLKPGQDTTSVAVGQLDASGNSDIVATTNANGGQVLVFQNTGGGTPTFSSTPVAFAAGAKPTNVTLADVDGNGTNDILVTNNNASGSLTILLNASTSGNIASESGTPGSNVTVTTSTAHGLANNTQVLVAGVTPAATAVNGIYSITNATTIPNKFDLSGTSTLTAATTGTGGKWYAVNFLSPVVYGTDANPQGLALADTNGDGRPDLLVTANSGNNDVSLLTSTETAAPFKTGTITAASNGPGIVIASANNLSLGDTVVIQGVGGNTAANGTWTVSGVSSTGFTLVGSTGNGTYTANTGTWISPGNLFQVSDNFALSGAGPAPSSVAVGDLNNDGIPDFAVALKGTKQVAIVLSNGKFDASGQPLYNSPFYVTVGTNPVSVAIGDVNNDGSKDIVVANQGSNTVTVLTNGGNGTTYSSSTVNVGKSPTQVVLGDLNGDGFLDLVVAHNQSGLFGTANRGVTVVLNKGGTTGSTQPFQGQTGTEFASGTAASAVALADFNHDGHLDFVVANNNAPGQVLLFNGDGTGNFTSAGTFATGVTNPDSIAVADFNMDGFPDVIVASSSTGATTGGVAVLLNQLGTGFSAPVLTPVLPGTGLASVVVTNVNQNIAGAATPDVFPDIVVSTLPGKNGSTLDDVYTLLGNGDGSFQDPMSYQVGGTGTPTMPPSYLAVTPSPLVRVTTFKTGGTTISANLVANGDFESRDLTGEQGNLLGWQTYDLPSNPGSNGHWSIQTGGTSPLSLVAVPKPSGKYQAMLDEADQQPYQAGKGNNNPNAASTYEGSHALYQDITIPTITAGTKVTLTLNLYIDDSGSATGYSNTNNGTQSLDWHGTTANQQVRIDLLNPADSSQNPNDPTADFLTVVLTTDSPPGAVLKNLWITDPSQKAVQSLALSFDLTAYAGSTIRLRIGSANNQGKLIVGVDNVKIVAQFSDTSAPTLSNLSMRNPGFFVPPTATAVDTLSSGSIATITITNGGSGYTSAPTVTFSPAPAGGTTATGTAILTNGVVTGVTFTSVGSGYITAPTVTFSAPPGSIPHTTDTTIVGQVSDNGSLNNLAFAAFDASGAGFSAGDTLYKITNFDAQGHFSFTVPGLLPGLHTIGVQLADKAGNTTTTSITFFQENNNQTGWMAYGPDQIDVTNQGVDYSTVSGRVTSVVADPTDPNGNTYFVGSANGGVWRTTDGGSSWLPLMDYMTDGSGNPVPAPIGAIATGLDNSVPTSPKLVMYAGTGVADIAFDSRPGVGVFKSIDGGTSWTLVGNSGTVLAGARISAMAVSNNDPNIVYAAVASGGNAGPGVYKSTDGGTTWVDVMTPAAMGLAAGTQLASVTSLVIDPFNSHRILVGLGNIGLVPASSTAGLWISTTDGASWTQPLGGANNLGLAVPSSTLPHGGALGRVTVAISSEKVGSEAVVYILIGTPPGNNTPPNVDLGTFSGLYKTSNNFLDFTKVMLRQDTSTGTTHSFTDINLLGQDASYVGALTVDPSDPNVVYVGGSSVWASNANLAHALVRIDTGNMRDANYVSGGSIANDGDDITKAARAAAQGGYYDPSTKLDAYTGEGVSWYDLIEKSSNSTGKATMMPPEIHALTFDSQGRLLIGTEGGLWRAVNDGYGYDFGSGGRGILGGKSFKPPGASLTQINGNLQISDLTSVAIDPTTRGQLYTTQAGTGTAGSTAPLQWVSEGLTGPTVGGNNLGIDTAGTVRVATPTPGAAPGTPTTLYRVWRFANALALYPETSTDGGVTFAPVANTGIPASNNPAGMFPAFTINPDKVLDNGVYEDELLFGTSLVFLSDTSGNVWDAVPASADANPTSPIPLAAGNLITALAVAPSTSGVYYAGTDKGKVFVTFNRGGDNWLERDTGLPAAKVNNITVDPNNDLIAYVMFASSAGNAVWHTVDGGQHWQSLSSGLPSVPANAMVIDPRTTGGAVNGRIYVATDVGVFISQDLGTTWTRLGQGLPNVPVVDLQFNQNLETLAAATQGRGAFTISTDLIGPHVTAISSPAGTAAVQITFSEPINPTTLTTSALSIVGPSGTVNITGINDLDPTNHDVFQITFAAAPTNPTGSYTLTLQPTVTDLANNPMDQNQNGVNGEVPGDVYTGHFIYQTTSTTSTPAHKAPTLGVTSAAVNSILENQTSNSGEDLATFAASLNIVSDSHSGALKGLAITGVDNSNGTWQFSTDGGNTWTNFGTPTVNAARLLQASSTNRIRFVPSTNFNGTATFTYRAWDLTSGLDPVTGADATVGPAIPGGGSTAFSTAEGTATLTVLPVNQPPSFTAGPNVSALENAGLQTVPGWAANISPGPANESSQTVSFLISVSDPTLFAVLPAVSSSGTLTYTPALDANGTVTVTVQAHDNGGTANGGQDTSAGQQFTITIIPVNQPPTFTVGQNVTVTRDVGAVTLIQWVTAISPGAPNEAGQTLNFIVTTNNLSLFSVQPTIRPDGTLTFTPSALTGSAVVTVQLHDNGGTANGGKDTSAAQTFTITVQGVSFRGSPNEVWVNQIYLDELGRPVDPAALTFWTGQIEELGVSRTTIAEEILNSPEYRTKLIQNLFLTLLGRPASSSDVAGFYQFMLGGGTIEQMKAMFLSSPEYLGHHGVTSAAVWVNAVYQDVLGHPADANATGYWGPYTASHTLYDTALAIESSSEASGTMVRHLYETLLGRDPQPSEGVISWYVDLQQGVRDEVVIGGIAASDEYFIRLSQYVNNQPQMKNWISGVYLDVLGRPIDPTGLSIWTNALNHGIPRVFITDEIVGSAEYQTHEINLAYQTLLHRPADPVGLFDSQQILNQGGTIEQVKAMLIGSDEYYFGRAGGSPFNFLNLLYKDVLGGPIDSGGVAFWGGLLAGGMDRGTLALQFLTSTSAEQALVQDFYLATLRRSADPGGMAYWSGLVESGTPDQLVLAGLVSTHEYFARFPNS
jgi:hypothetical protein